MYAPEQDEMGGEERIRPAHFAHVPKAQNPHLTP